MEVDLVAAYDTIAGLVRESKNLQHSWTSLISYGESLVPAAEWTAVKDLDIARDVALVKEQINIITKSEPIPPDVTCLYFGLFTAAYEGTDKPCAGFYISGVVDYDPEDPDSVCDPFYFPEERYIQSPILDVIMDYAQSDLPISELMDYAIMLGAAGLIAKYAMQEKQQLQVVVGFDDGDAMEV